MMTVRYTLPSAHRTERRIGQMEKTMQFPQLRSVRCPIWRQRKKTVFGESQEVDALYKLKQKLKSQTGASITFALLLFLVCAVVGSVVLTAGTAAAGRMSELAKMDQRYYSVTSAAQLLRDTIEGKQVKVTQNYISIDGAAPSPQGGQTFEGADSPVLRDAAEKLTGTTEIGEDGLERNWNLTVTNGPENAALNVKIEETLSPDGTMTMRISNDANNNSGGTTGPAYVYTLQMVFSADKVESVDSRMKEQYTPEGKKTVIKTETKTTSITWKLNSIGKAMAEPVSTGG